MAIMSTHPRDYPTLIKMMEEEEQYMIHQCKTNGQNNNNHSLKIVPCLGVHPWFLHELEKDDWSIVCWSENSSRSSNQDNGASRIEPQQQQQQDESAESRIPQWVATLEDWLLAHPHVPVGEIGLDNFHFDPITKQLTTPMDVQVAAFRYQLELATKHQRPVSIHCVRAMGKIMETIDQVYQAHRRLPPRLYFHAFGGKAATATQLFTTIEKKKPRVPKETVARHRTQMEDNSHASAAPKVYFGFAPIINFESHKTMDVIRAVGLQRLVLETDHEDIRCIPSSMKDGLKAISNALSITEEELIQATNTNVKDLYSL
jgi:TatD DNase family protein